MSRDADTAAPAAPGLWPVDRLLLSTLAALGALAAACHPRPAPLLLAFGALALFLWSSASFGPRSRAGEALHSFAPLFVILGIYETVGFVVGAVNPVRWDGTFAALDARLFGPIVPAWRHALGRPSWLSDAASIAYVSYYVVPTAMGLALYLQRRRGDFDRLAFDLQLTLVASYAGYFLFPTAGPRVPVAQAAVALGGGAVSEAVRLFIHTCELNDFDAFPSGHTAISLVFLADGWRMFPRWRVPLAATAASIVFSTVYLSHHYAVDLLGGALVAAGVLAGAPYLRRALGFGARASTDPGSTEGRTAGARPRDTPGAS